MKVRLKVDVAGLDEPYWWHSDRFGFRIVTLLSAYRASKPEVDGVAIYGLILGPLHIRVGILRGE